MIGERVQIRAFAAVVQDFGKARIGGNLDTGGLLPCAARVFGDLGQAQVGEIISQRGFDMVDKHGCHIQSKLLRSFCDFSKKEWKSRTNSCMIEINPISAL